MQIATENDVTSSQLLQKCLKSPYMCIACPSAALCSIELLSEAGSSFRYIYDLFSKAAISKLVKKKIVHQSELKVNVFLLLQSELSPSI